MENQVTLYIAIHNKTEKKYFGKTTRYFTEEDLQKYYHGSGVYWKNHLNKHGDDVTMEIYGIYNLDEVKEVALKFSEDNDIVNSKEWANLILENGISGGDNSKNIDYSKVSLSQKGKSKHTEEYKLRLSKIHKNKKVSSETKEKQSKAQMGKILSDETKTKISIAFKGKPRSQEIKDKIRDKQKGIKRGPQETKECPHCGKICGLSSSKRYHFDNCKLKE